MASDQQALTAVLDAINAALPATVRAYEPGDVPPTRPAEYLTVTVARRPGGTPRGGRFSTAGWSAYVMAASSVSDSNARNSLKTANDALENRVLTAAGAESTPVRFANARAVAPDSGWFTGVNTYTFAI